MNTKRCIVCKRKLPPDSRSDKRHCDAVCRVYAQRIRESATRQTERAVEGKAEQVEELANTALAAATGAALSITLAHEVAPLHRASDAEQEVEALRRKLNEAMEQLNLLNASQQECRELRQQLSDAKANERQNAELAAELIAAGEKFEDEVLVEKMRCVLLREFHKEQRGEQEEQLRQAGLHQQRIERTNAELTKERAKLRSQLQTAAGLNKQLAAGQMATTRRLEQLGKRCDLLTGKKREAQRCLLGEKKESAALRRQLKATEENFQKLLVDHHTLAKNWKLLVSEHDVLISNFNILTGKFNRLLSDHRKEMRRFNLLIGSVTGTGIFSSVPNANLRQLSEGRGELLTPRLQKELPAIEHEQWKKGKCRLLARISSLEECLERDAANAAKLTALVKEQRRKLRQSIARGQLPNRSRWTSFLRLIGGSATGGAVMGLTAVAVKRLGTSKRESQALPPAPIEKAKRLTGRVGNS